jgi:hypothetical protein
MAELAASLIGIVSAGTSITLVLSELAVKLGSVGQEARLIASEIRCFCDVLTTLRRTLERVQKSDYYDHCREVTAAMTSASLEMFDEILKVTQSLMKIAGSGHKDEKLKTGLNIVERVDWVAFKKPKIMMLRAALEAYKSNLALMLGTLDVTEKVARTR